MRIEEVILVLGMFVLVSGFVSAEFIWGDDDSRTEFDILEQGLHCANDVFGEAYWETIDTSVSSMNDCYKDSSENPWPSSTCCPYPTHTCNTASGECELNPIQYCDEYNEENFGSGAENACENANSGVGNATIFRDTEGEIYLGLSYYANGCTEAVVKTYCEWDEGSCNGGFDVESTCSTDDPYGRCVFHVLDVVDDCNNTGKMFYNRSATWTGSESALGRSSCVDDIIEALCGNPLIKLPFFTAINVILVVIVIAIYYWWQGKGEKKKGKSGKRKSKEKK